MTSSENNLSMAVFCDFENVALGVRDAEYDSFDIKPVLERLLLKGSIVVKKAYCNWDRYKPFKAAMHEANFELIEIPHVRQSGKNSADIRLVVDALDLCYTKAHVNTFVIISGDSDFSPLVSKLRENAKKVIGVGVKQSTSDLLVANCDEFIFYDDLVRERQRNDARRGGRGQGSSRRAGNDDKRGAQAEDKREDKPRSKDDVETRRTRAIEIAVETFDALVSERGDTGKMWASVLKEAIKRRKPDFNESYFGFRTFGNLLEEAQARGLLSFGRDDKSGAYVYRAASDRTTIDEHAGEPAATVALAHAAGEVARAAAQALNTASQDGVADAAEAAQTRPARDHQSARARKRAQQETGVQADAPSAHVPQSPEAPPAASRGGRGRRGGRRDDAQAASVTADTSSDHVPAAPAPATAAPTAARPAEPVVADPASVAPPAAPKRVPSRARTAAALPPVPSAPGTILAMPTEAEADEAPKRRSRKPRAAVTESAAADTAAPQAEAVPAPRPRRARKTAQAPKADS